MATLYSLEAADYLNSVPAKMANGAVHQGRTRRVRCTVNLASQGTSDTIVLCKLNAGMAFAFGVLTADTSLGSSTVAIGITGTTGKYRAAATFTATNTPTLFGLAGTIDDAPLTGDETVFITIGAAALPASGILVVDLFVSTT
jgi:hypothetical protein